MFIPQPKGEESFKVSAAKAPKGALKIMLFSTLVLILEVLAFSLAMGMGMSLGITIASNYNFIYIINLLLVKLQSYVTVCVPVLLVSAYLEATVIKESEAKAKA